jgi:hypothetical protein
MVALASVRRSEESTMPVEGSCLPACPVCGGRLLDIRGEHSCSECHTPCESASDGNPWWLAERESAGL